MMRPTSHAAAVALPLGLLWLGLLAGCAAAPTTPAQATPIPNPQSSVRVGDTTVLAVGPSQPCCPKQTLPEFLGLKQLGAGVTGLTRRIWSRIQTGLGLEGRLPGLQPKPPILPITDPSNLSPDAPPAVQAAAEVKKEEDEAGQKVQALRYLASVGCGGCYPSVEEALLAALDDCTEAVRYEAVVALRGNSQRHCKLCNSKACCSAKIQKKLQQVAYETDALGCFKEPSARVRRLARQALCFCGGIFDAEPARPEEGPPEPLPAPAEGPPAELAQSSHAGGPLLLVDLPPPDNSADDPVLAWVQETPIHAGQLEPLIEAGLVARGSPEAQAEARRKRAQQMLRSAVDTELLRQELLQDRPVALAGHSGPPTANEIRSWLSERLPIDTFVTSGEVAWYYQQHPAEFHQPAAVRWERVRVPLNRFRGPEQAQAVASYFRHRALGQQTAPPEFQPGQVEIETLGWTNEREVAEPRVAKILFSLPVGGTSSILEGRGEYLIVRVLERRAAQHLDLDAATPRIVEIILQQRRQQAQQAYVAELRRARGL